MHRAGTSDRDEQVWIRRLVERGVGDGISAGEVPHVVALHLAVLRVLDRREELDRRAAARLGDRLEALDRIGDNRRGLRARHRAHPERGAALGDHLEALRAGAGHRGADRVVGGTHVAVEAIGIAVADVVERDTGASRGTDGERELVQHRGLASVRLAVFLPRDHRGTGTHVARVRGVVVELLRDLDPHRVVARRQRRGDRPRELRRRAVRRRGLRDGVERVERGVHVHALAIVHRDALRVLTGRIQADAAGHDALVGEHSVRRGARQRIPRRLAVHHRAAVMLLLRALVERVTQVVLVGVLERDQRELEKITRAVEVLAVRPHGERRDAAAVGPEGTGVEVDAARTIAEPIRARLRRDVDRVDEHAARVLEPHDHLGGLVLARRQIGSADRLVVHVDAAFVFGQRGRTYGGQGDNERRGTANERHLPHYCQPPARWRGFPLTTTRHPGRIAQTMSHPRPSVPAWHGRRPPTTSFSISRRFLTISAGSAPREITGCPRFHRCGHTALSSLDVCG